MFPQKLTAPLEVGLVSELQAYEGSSSRPHVVYVDPHARHLATTTATMNTL
jgi:hypothetical protein